MDEILDRISKIGIVPVVKITNPEHTIPLTQALYKGGIDVAEITYRSEYATEAIRSISTNIPNMLVGAGTVTTVQQAVEAIEAGASFIVTPGFNPSVVSWCKEHSILILPGVSTASEIEQALTYDLKVLKFFPAESSGGAKKLKDFYGPYADIKFIPTGGINAVNMHDYLNLPNVLAIGGSFMLPNDLIHAEDWNSIEVLSSHAIKSLLDYQLIHLGINTNSEEHSLEIAKQFCKLFHFTYYKKPKSNFAGKGFEIMHKPSRGTNGHIGIFTRYPERALYQLAKENIYAIEETITRNKKTNKINFVYLDLEIGGFAVHLINPDVQMEV